LTKKFPKEELFTLTSQMRRSVISVPCNIAEGYARHGTKDYVHFISIAIGSLAELETQLLLASDLEYLLEKEIISVLDEIHVLQKCSTKCGNLLSRSLRLMPNAQGLMPYLTTL
jgi:four helix bundle protein